MKRARLVLFPVVALATVVPALAVGGALAPAGAAAATTCLGKPVTIVASREVTTGTEGDDVVVMTPGGWREFDALGGHDTVCLAVGDVITGRDTLPPHGLLHAGPGDDVVVNEAGGPASSSVTVFLGAGDDRFTGSSSEMVETVHADAERADALTPPAGTQRDVIDMGGGLLNTYDHSDDTDQVITAAPPGGLNADVITFGPGAAAVRYEGVMAPEGRIDLSAADWATMNLLEVPATAGAGAAAELLVDAPARRANVDGVQVLTWEGPVDRWVFGHRDDPYWWNHVSFLGTDADEHLEFEDGVAADLRLGGGDDTVVDGYESRSLRTLDGGPGQDRLAFSWWCADLKVRLEERTTCDGRTTPLVGFEEVELRNAQDHGRLTVVGTDADDRVTAYAHHVTFRGRRGADKAGMGGTRVRAHGGPGADELRANARNVVLRGQRGPDLLRLHYKNDDSRQQVALGGRGRDRLVGTTVKAKRGDRLVGGRGRDLADGDSGKNDYCDAEVTRRCERGPRTRR